MKTISLTQNQITLVDDSDFEWLSHWKWMARTVNGRKFYVARIDYRNNNPKGKLVLMHRLIVNPPLNMEVDHINGDSLDNQRHNLRIATSTQNKINTPMDKAVNTSGYKGVSWHKRNNKWIAGIRIFGRQIHLGYFKTAKEGGAAYDKAAKEHYGEFARVNLCDQHSGEQREVEAQWDYVPKSSRCAVARTSEYSTLGDRP